MERTPVSSSNIAAVGHNSQSMVLEVEFNNGALYEYYEVSEQVYFDLINAGSVGGFFNSSVKNSYSCTRIQ